MRARGFLAAGFLIVSATGGFFAWQHFAPVAVTDGWTYRVYENGVPRASALARGKDADLYYSEELPNRQGRIVRRMADGSRREALAGLSKPDGLVAYRGGIAIAQEQGEFPVYWLRDGEISELFVGRQVEGLSTDGRSLYAIEDTQENGRILRYDPDTREVAVLRSGLIKGEGIAVCPDGSVFYAEKGRNRIMRLQVDGADQVIRQNLNKPGFLFCDGEGLWITEDSTHDARLMLLGPDGDLQVIARRLRAAQTFLPLGNDRFLLADQGRNRILELERLRR
jgi:hypothetical protein